MASKVRKRSLVASVAVLSLCIVALIGATFAWFTDTASTNVNKIQAGELNVKIQGKDGRDLEGQTLQVKQAGATEAGYVGIETVLWEPGCTFELEPLTIVNAGNLAFKFQATINESTAPATGAADLASVIEVYNGTTKLGTLRQLIDDNDGFAHGAILPTGATPTAAGEAVGSATMTISLKLPESVGNEYQGTTVGGDGFSITVTATQYTYEYDSTGNTYDANAKLPEIVTAGVKSSLSSVLEDASAISSNADASVTDMLDEYVAAGSDAPETVDVVVPAGQVITYATGDSYGSTAMAAESTQLVTIEGAADGTSTFVATGDGIRALENPDGKLVFKNINIVDNSISYAEGNFEMCYLEYAGDLYFENCNFYGGIMVKGVDSTATFKNCTFYPLSANKNSAYDRTQVYNFWLDSGTVSFEGCTFDGQGVSYGSMKVDGVYSPALGSDIALSLTNCTFKPTNTASNKPYVYVTHAGKVTITTSGNTYETWAKGNVVAKTANYDYTVNGTKMAEGVSYN